MAKKRNVVGVSWRRLEATPTPTKEAATPSSGKSKQRTRSRGSVDGVQAKVMTRMMSFRDTFDTLRQKIKLPTRTCKRLTNAATPTQRKSAAASATPCSSLRKVARGQHREFKMYSPFEIVTPTPARTPVNSIRMGTQRCKRFAFTNAGSTDADSDVMAIVDGVRSLTGRSTPSPAAAATVPCPPPSGGRSQRSGIRTTPKASARLAAKQPLFI